MGNRNRPDDTSPTKEELLECIARSGYLLESRLVQALTAGGYFVEPNQVVADRHTGKSREIDLVAEANDFLDIRSTRPKVLVKSTFVIEAINNDLPFVLVTPRPATPNQKFEDYVAYATTPKDPPFVHQLALYDVKDASTTNLYSQYCTIGRKNKGKGELMASHSEDVYGSLQKLAEYVDDEVRHFLQWTHERPDDYWRIFLWQPILVLKHQLMVLAEDDKGGPTLRDTKFARLEFNWHSGTERNATLINVVTANHLRQHLDSNIAVDEVIEAKLHALRLEHDNKQ